MAAARSWRPARSAQGGGGGRGAGPGRAAAVLEEPCGGVLYESNAGARMAPASITKIATALVAAERTDPSEMVDVEVDGGARAVETESTIMGLQPGMEG